MIKNKKVIFFDLFSTLVSLNDHNSGIPKASAYLGIDEKEWNRVSMSQYHDRGLGIVNQPFDIVSDIARTIQPELSDEMIEAAVQIRIARFKHCVVNPEEAVIDVLRCLKSSDYRLGLISNADVIDVMGWPESSLSPFFESVVFSCKAGVAKPDRGIYEKAMKELDVQAENCIFVGDGGSDELAGARKLGMTTVLTTQYRWQPSEALVRLAEDADYVIEHLEELCDVLGTVSIPSNNPE